ncbi:hypothetical protein DFP93_10870 [Aneurinibacillus soli]|uniref:Uncharacterized protein n=1 Tax=Aneurinibacillus soli TaxID=1500254 RepID=A0A0U4NC19_9BACL|nr:hypothetical protein [Aneurinibacillus soli]PYE61497.1 hypothetical protein DFP93_10870 [Aneurinibacillus soli]BAU26548.1 hypothetical protein CB4_00675 [Aneurinibacillus soli]
MNIHTVPKRSYPSHTREKFYERTKRLFPGHANATYINTSDPAYYEKLLRANRTHVRALYELGRQYEKQGFWRKAADYYDRAVLADPCFEPAVGAKILLARRRQQKEHIEARTRAHTASPVRKKLSLIQMTSAVLLGYTLLATLAFVLLR